ncbi:MAG: type II secretion system protein [Verrucomicrobiaceae bacterium]|nr:type II secretion system protein [Verrucomicrobiaceae bacterium]
MSYPLKRIKIYKPKSYGFSLIELLTVIVVIAFLATIAIMGFRVAHEGAKEQRDKRNAQEIANVASFASAAGAKFVVSGDEQASIYKLKDGCSATSGAFKGRLFQIPSMGDAEITGAMRFLALSDQDLIYIQTESSEGNYSANP